MTTTLEELLEERDEDSYKTEILEDLAAEDLPTTSWQPGSVPRTMTAIQARLMADFNTSLRAVAAGGLLVDATGDWLTMLADQVYDVQRDDAVATIGLVMLTDAGGGPHSVAVGGTVSDGSRTYRYTTAGTLPLNKSIFLQVTADELGSNGNASNGTITTLVSALAGVTVNNPIPWVSRLGTASVKTRGYVKLTSTGGGSVSAGGCTVSDGAGHLYTNVSSATLVAATQQEVLFEAAAAGADYNVGNGLITTVTVNPLGDISATNTAPSTSLTTWITTAGADEQTDAELRTECEEKWATQGVGWTSEAIAYLAKQAETSTPVKRVKVVSNPGAVAYRVGVTIASAAGAMSSDDVTAVQAYFDDDRETLTSEVVVASASTLSVTISGTVYVPQAYLAQAQADATTNLIALEASVPIGGNDDAANAVQLEDILAAIKNAIYDPTTGENTNPASPIRIQLSAPTGDTSLTAYQVPDFNTSGLVFTGV